MLSDLDPVWVLTAVAVGVFGIIATVLLREKLLQKRKAHSEVVLGSATVALVSGLVLPWVVPSLALKVAAVVASGTYAGMVSRKVVAVAVHLVLAGVVVGLLNVLMSTVFIGVGGKLGFIGLLGIALFHYLEDHAHKPAQSQVVAKIG